MKRLVRNRLAIRRSKNFDNFFDQLSLDFGVLG
jgi:hypothetical protein